MAVSARGSASSQNDGSFSVALNKPPHFAPVTAAGNIAPSLMLMAEVVASQRGIGWKNYVAPSPTRTAPPHQLQALRQLFHRGRPC
jgi:hypothetical protein